LNCVRRDQAVRRVTFERFLRGSHFWQEVTCYYGCFLDEGEPDDGKNPGCRAFSVCG